MVSPLPVVPTVDCEDPTCSGNGICQHDQCYCYPGYTGNTCNKRVPPDTAQPQPTAPSNGGSVTDNMMVTTVDPGSVTPEWGKVGCSSMDCSLHGVFDPSRAICMCDYGWTGRACEQGTTITGYTNTLCTVHHLNLLDTVQQHISV